MKKATVLIMGLITLLSLGSLALSQPAETPQPAATEAANPAQPAAPAAATAPDATAEPPSEGNASEGSVSNETGKSEEEGEVTLDELLDMLLKVVTDFRTTGLLAGFIAIIALLIYALRYPRLNAWLEKKGWKPYKVYIAAGLSGVSTCLAALAAGTIWWKALLAGAGGIVAGLAVTGLHQAKDALKRDKKLK